MNKSFLARKLQPVIPFQRQKNPCPSSLYYFLIYFNFAYYLGISPFHFRYKAETDSYTIQSTRKQNAVCFLAQAFCLYQFASLFRGIDLEALRLNPNNFFELANVLGFSLYLLVLFSTLWMKRNCFSKIFSTIQSSQFSTYNLGSPVSSFFLTVLCCFMFIAWSLYNVLAQDVAIHKWEVLNIPENFTNRAMFVYLYESRATFESSGYNKNFLKLLSCWYALVEFYQWLSTHFTDLLLLITALFLREIAIDFSLGLKTEEYKINGIEYYKWIKSTIKEANSALGDLTLCVVVTALPYYASNVETVIGTSDLVRKFRITFFCAVFFVSLSIAADANQKVNEIKDWIMDDENVRNIPQSTLLVIVNEVSQIGLKGCGFFTVTFGFLGTIVSIVLTYAIIIVQFQIPQSPCNSSSICNNSLNYANTN